MSWWQFAILGAGGGTLVEVLSLYKWINVWQNDRRRTTGELKVVPPPWRSYVDMPAHAWMLPLRMVLGAAAALLFGTTGQISGAYAAVAFGLAAPAVLTKLGSFPPVADAVKRQELQHSAGSDALSGRPAHAPTAEPAEGSGA